MASRSLNKVILIGNLTRDPELRYTPQGTPVCTFGIATNRSWSTDTGEKKEDAEFHTIVAWNRLAEIVAEFLQKGRQAYIEGRLQTREWDAPDGTKRQRTEIIASEVIFLGSGATGPAEPGAAAAAGGDDLDVPADFGLGEPSKGLVADAEAPIEKPAKAGKKEEGSPAEPGVAEGDEDIPF
ncbi:MAG: single-stranded DNA-binding protein [bacterium]|nr:single-stranded DNA-binding protein [bacterium]